MQTLPERGGKDALLRLCREQTPTNARVVCAESLAGWMDEFAAKMGV